MIAGNSTGTHPSVLPRPGTAVPALRPITALVSFETLFLLFLFAGIFKAMPEVAWLPVDITAAFFVISGAAALILGSTHVHPASPGMLFYLAFVAWGITSLLWSSLTSVNIAKAFYTATLLSWSFFGAYMFVAGAYRRYRRFVIGFIIISLFLLSYWAYYRFLVGGTGLESNNHLIYSYQALYLMQIFIAFSIASRGAAGSVAATFGIGGMMIVMLFIGGRGPLILSALVLLQAMLFLLLNPRARRYRDRSLRLLLGLFVVAGVVAVTVHWLSADLMQHVEANMTTIQRFSDSETTSVAQRMYGKTFALDRWQEAPIIGWGIGEFTVLEPVLRYPHNLFLEILMEMGIIGFYLLVALMGLGAYRAWQLWPTDRADWVLIALVLLFATELIVNATIQGYLPDNRFLFAFLGLVLGLRRGAADRRSAA